jgi:hypothetical protein
VLGLFLRKVSRSVSPYKDVSGTYNFFSDILARVVNENPGYPIPKNLPEPGNFFSRKRILWCIELLLQCRKSVIKLNPAMHVTSRLYSQLSCSLDSM